MAKEAVIEKTTKSTSAALSQLRADLVDRSASFILPAFLLLVWQILSNFGVIIEAVLPSPVKVLQALQQITQDGTLWVDFAASGFRVLTGFFWGALLGLIFGVLCGLFNFMERLLGPVVDAVRQVSTYAWIPLIVLWFGIGETSKYVIIAKAVFIPVFINTLQGIRGVSTDYIEVAQVLELTHWRFLRKVVIPSALPSIYTGIRLGAGFAWMAVVAAEMLGGLTGLGYALLQAKDFLQSDKLIALMVVIGAIGLTVDWGIKKLELSTLHWRKSFSGSKK